MHGVKAKANYVRNFFEGFDEVICVNLKRAGDRRQYIKNIFNEKEVDLPFFFEATNQDDEDVEKYFSLGLVKLYPDCFRCGKKSCGNSECNNVLTRPQVATFITYLNIFKYIKKKKLRNVLIIEDDIAFCEDTNKRCQQVVENGLINVIKSDSEAVLLRFGWAKGDEHNKKTEAKLEPNLLRMSNPCFAINYLMADKLLKKCGKVDTTADIYIHDRVGMNVKNFTLNPPLFYEKSWSTGELASMIHPKEIRASFLKNFFGRESKEYKTYLSEMDKYIKHIFNFSCVVMGHPRCGSGYISELLRSYRIDVGHEKMGKDGISSWMFAVDDLYPYYEGSLAKRRSDKVFDYLICHVRNPADAVPSIALDNLHSNESYEFRRKHIKKSFDVDLNEFESNFERAVASYVFWYKIILMQSPDIIVRIEDDQTKLKKFLLEKHLIHRFNLMKIQPKKNINKDKKYKGKSYVKEQYTQNDWNELPEILIFLVNDLCQIFGYKSPIK